jgi:methylthioribose-1-phosphate isomerase
METVTDAVSKLWFLGAGIVAIAAYAVTIKVRLDYLEKNYDRQITALWDQVNKLLKEQRSNAN